MPCLLFLLLAGCGGDATESGPSTTATPPRVAAPAPEAEDTVRVVFLGDSLTAGYGLAEEQAFPALVATALRDEGFAVDVVNAGVSGDTSAGGLSRIDWVLQQAPDVMVIGLGGNDALRGQDLASTEANLRAIVQRAQDSGARVLLLGMRIPPNYGPDYAEAFANLYPKLARELDVELMPFLLEDVGGVRRLNQPDGIHPTAEGQQRVAENVVEYVRPLVEESADG